MVVDYEDGADLSQSRRRPGGYSPLTRDSDRKLGQVILEEPDWGELQRMVGAPRSGESFNSRASAVQLTRTGQVIADMCTPLIEAGVDALGRRVERWFDERACPAIKSAAQSSWIRLTKPRSSRRPGPGTRAVALVDSASESSSIVRRHADVERSPMSRQPREKVQPTAYERARGSGTPIRTSRSRGAQRTVTDPLHTYAGEPSAPT